MKNLKCRVYISVSVHWPTLVGPTEINGFYSHKIHERLTINFTCIFMQTMVLLRFIAPSDEQTRS